MEWVEPLRRKTDFDGSNHAAVIYIEPWGFFNIATERSRYPHIRKLTDYCGVGIHTLSCHGAKRVFVVCYGADIHPLHKSRSGAVRQPES